ncbi:hypothetical protein [Vulcanisaeta distributa]|uniref:hypothetical protein n=1 Tax=Vulcanisaeta distributa TaxID=164451 RepID=UPI001FB307C3|nr:hypothetical protein [Vulcanisaeta distributa]
MQAQRLQKLSDNVYVVLGRTNAGVLVIDNNECVIVDTGIDEDSGRRILNAIKPPKPEGSGHSQYPPPRRPHWW